MTTKSISAAMNNSSLIPRTPAVPKMTFPDDQIKELKTLCPGAAQSEEGGKPYFLLPGLNFSESATPSKCDCLLCPVERDGYASRLFFAKQIGSPRQLNWNASNVSILGCLWFAHSWRVRAGLRL